MLGNFESILTPDSASFRHFFFIFLSSAHVVRIGVHLSAHGCVGAKIGCVTDQQNPGLKSISRLIIKIVVCSYTGRFTAHLHCLLHAHG